MAEHGISHRFGDAFGRLMRPEKLASLLLLFLLLTVATASVTSVLIGPDWSSLWKGLLIGLLAGWLLAIFRQPAPRSLLIILIVGITYTLLSAGSLGQRVTPLLLEPLRLWVAFLSSPGMVKPDLTPLLGLIQELAAAMVVVLKRIADWLSAMSAGEPTFDPLAAGITWGMLVLLVAAWAGWMVEAGKNGLLAVAPAILLSVGTLSYVRRSTSSLYIIMGLALILLATVQHDRREGEWEASAVAYPARKGRQVGTVAILLTAGLVLVSAFVSSISLQKVERWLTVQGRQAEPENDNLAKSLGIVQPSERVVDTFEAVRRPGLPRDLLIGSGPELSRELVMTVEVNDLTAVLQASRPWPLYWRSFTYDVYNGRGWQSSNTEESIYEAIQPIEKEKLPNHLSLQEAFRPAMPVDRSVYAAGEPVLVDQQSLAAWRSDGDLFGAELATPGSYTVRSLVPAVDEQNLRLAGQRYPDWVRRRYLALPPDLPGRVKELAIQLTGTEPTPYDRVRSIERYLRTFPYTVDVPRPPSSQDLVDYFLFDLKEGYCDYYASAMVVLARAAGVPARLAIGYASGEYNEKSRRFMVTRADAHSWVEVYFPNAGWVPFEPTASRPLLEAAPRIPSALPAETAPPGIPETPVVSSKAWMWIFIPVALLLATLLLLAWMIYDHLRLSRMPEPVAAVEVYRRLRWYGARLAAAAGAGDTPYEYAASLSRRLEQLAVGGISHGFGLSTAGEVQAIADRIVDVSYSPGWSDSTASQILPQWRRLRWGLILMVVLKYWKALGESFPGLGKNNPDEPTRAGIDYNPGEDQEE